MPPADATGVPARGPRAPDAERKSGTTDPVFHAGRPSQEREGWFGDTAMVAGALLGNLAGMNAVLMFTMGVFISAFHTAYGWTRADISIAMTCFTVVAFLGSALIGRLADEVEPRILIAVSMAAFGVGLVLVPHLIHSVYSLWFAYTALAIVGLGTSSAVVSRPIVASFTRRRGVAVGIAMTGSAIGAFLLPQFAAALVVRGGWAAGYFGLGCLVLAAAPLVWLGLGQRKAHKSPRSPVSKIAEPGLPLREIMKSRIFWFLSLISVIAGMGMSGPTAHLIPLLGDHGVEPAAAAGIASLIGLSGIVGRIVTGTALDRFRGPFLGLPVLGIGAVGVLLLAHFNAYTTVFAVMGLGFAIGGELDLLAYFISRYFGLRSHATVFGWNCGMVALGASIGPVIVGALRDHLGNYDLALTLSGIAIAIAALMCPLLGSYRYETALAEREG